MRATIWICVLLLVGVGVLVPCVGCGGGGGGGGPTPSLFAGTYYLSHIRATGGPPRSLTTGWGKSLADGFGSFSGDLTTNSSGVVVGPNPFTDFVPMVGTDRSFTWEATTAPGVTVIRGGISPTGAVAAASVVEAGANAGLMILTRQAGAHDLGTLNGDYHACGFRHAVGSDAFDSYFGSATFDGLGDGSQLVTTNREGTLLFPLGSSLFTYGVTAAGSTTLDFTGGNTRQGGIVAGGELVVVAGAPTNLVSPVLYAMVRESTAASLATLSGRYFVVGLRYVVGTTSILSVRGTADADGAGAVTVTLTANVEGTAATLPADASTYTVALDGRLVVTNSAGDVLEGGVSSTGDFAIVSGGTTGGQDPMFLLLFR